MRRVRRGIALRAVKQRFETLDAMRGVAAVVVLLYHVHIAFFAPTCTVSGSCAIPSGFLAVDMFFALSGFVLSYSYDPAFACGMKAAQFMRLRVIRLAPIFWVGAAIGAVPLLLDLRYGASIFSTIKVLAFNGLLLPSPTFHSHIDPFPLVSPAWSLFFELWVANLLFAAIGTRLRRPVLSGIVLAGAAGLFCAAIRYGNLDVGSLWSNFIGGFPRVIYSFFAGVAVQRIHARHGAVQVPAMLVLAALVASFLIRVPASISVEYELGCVLVLYPVLIFLGASAIERRPRIGKLLGNASYALYVIHIPMLLLLLRVMQHFAIGPSYVLAAAFAITTLAAAMAVSKFYDERARQLLKRSFPI